MNSTSFDYYQLLGISPDATTAELRSAYRKLALQHHPDRNPGDPGAEERFKQINAAYQVLSDPVERAAYDRRTVRPAVSQAGEPPHPAPQAAAWPAKPNPAGLIPTWIWLVGVGLPVVLLFGLSGLVFWQNYSRSHFLPAHIASAPTPRFQGVTGLPYLSPVPSPSPTLTEMPSPDPVSSAPALPLTRNPLAVGIAHACALTNTGSVKCWGDNTRNQLGDGTTTGSLVPVNVHGLDAGVVAITAGGYHTCALLESGGVKCWGENFLGELGDGTTTKHAEPVDVSGLAGGVSAISAGNDYTCALTDHGAVKCWGGEVQQALGSNYPNEIYTVPVEIAGLDQSAVALGVGDSHACVLTVAGAVECWGANDAKQLGRRVPSGASFPVGDVSTLAAGSGVIAIAVGGEHTCALTHVGGVKCWGGNGAGQLGNGTFGTNWEQILSLGDVKGLNGGVKSIFVGGGSTCALMDTGALECWGWIGHADGSPINFVSPQRSAIPVEITTVKDGVKALALGHNEICVLTNSDHVECWGANDSGQLGNGTRVGSTTPVDVVGLDSAIPTPQATGADITATPTPLPAETPTAP